MMLHIPNRITLQDLLSFIPEDDIPPSVSWVEDRFITLPNDDELIRKPVSETRELLNRAVASIIPPDTSPHSDDIDKLDQFYRDHLKAIHMHG